MSVNPRVLETPLVSAVAMNGIELKIKARVTVRANIDRLVGGAADYLVRHGGDPENITIIRVPGAFEMPLAAKKLAKSARYHFIVCVGAVIRGSTPHFDFVASECAKGLAQVSMESGVPIGFGVLTTDNLEQAIERAGSKAGNKGVDCAMTAMEMVNLFKEM